MATYSSYPQVDYTNELKLLAGDPSRSELVRVSGQSLFDYLNENLDQFDEALLGFTTTDVAVNEDLPIGKIIYTTGGSAIDDGSGGPFIVVAAGDGDIPMFNGNELLSLPFGSLTGSDVTNALVTTADQGTQTVAEYVSNRTKYVESISAMEVLSEVPGTNLYLTQEGRAGSFVVKSGTPPADPQKGVYVVLANGNYAERKFSGAASFKWFGAVGDNSTDDTIALQAALDFVGLNRGLSIELPAGKYKISSGLVFKPASVPAALPGSDIHFTDHVESVIYGSGDARIIASTAITTMLLVSFNSATSSIGPFYTEIKSITFDGDNLASEGLRSDFVLHLSITKNKFWRLNTGVYFIGYGVARIRDNVFKTTYCIDFAEGGGDSVITGNDFYPLENGRGVSYGKLSGNSVVSNNIFSGEGNLNAYGVYIDGDQFLSTDTIRNVRVLSNEFSGMKAGVFGVRHVSARNVYGIVVSGNHTTAAAGGGVHTGTIVNFEGIDDAIISDNYINSVNQGATITSDPGIQLVDCLRPIVSGNSFGNLLGPAIYMRTTTTGAFYSNSAQDTGRSGSSAVVWDVDTGCQYNKIYENNIYQSSASFAQNPVIERAGANNNEFLRNTIRGTSQGITKAGAATVISGRVVAAGAYASSTAGAGLLWGSGFTVSRSSVGVVNVSFTTPRINTNYAVKVTTDTFMTAVDSFSTTGFTVRTLNQAGTAQDPARANIEVTA